MADLETLKGLLARTRAAEAPDQDLDRAIGAAFPPPGGWYDEEFIPAYTRSIDDAVSFIGGTLPKWDVEFEIIGVGGLKKGWATVRGPEFCDRDMSQFAQTDGLPKPPPLALMDAALSALLAQAESPTTSAGGRDA